MFQILNKTPFEASLNLFTDKDGVNLISGAVKATFGMPDVKTADEQLPVLDINEYYGEPGKSSIKYPYDLVLGKANTDIGLIGTAYSPDKMPVERFDVSLEIGNVKKNIAVFGDREWEKDIVGFTMTKPKRFTEMPITYELAFGGIDDTHEDEKKHGMYEKNAVGVGVYINREQEGLNLPNLEDPNDLIV